MPLKNSDKSHLIDLLDVMDSDDITTKLKLQFIEHLNQLGERGKTDKLWLQYFEPKIDMHLTQVERM